MTKKITILPIIKNRFVENNQRQYFVNYFFNSVARLIYLDKNEPVDAENEQKNQNLLYLSIFSILSILRSSSQEKFRWRV